MMIYCELISEVFIRIERLVQVFLCSVLLTTKFNLVLVIIQSSKLFLFWSRINQKKKGH